MLTGSITGIPDDLKKKLYNLNDLDLTIKNKNIEIMNKINDKLDEFINDIQKYIIKKYNNSYIEFSIEDNYDKTLLPMIQSTLFNVETFINKYCRNYLENYLKKPFIELYKNVIEEKSNEMILFSNEQKETIRNNLYEKETTITDNTINNIEEKSNKTQDSINKYLSHFKTFKIDNEFVEFLNNIGKINIHPLFSPLVSTINEAKSNNKNTIINIVNENSIKYENLLDVNTFVNLSNDINLYFKNNYIKNLTECIDLYNPNNYKQNFEKQKTDYEKRYLRNLEGNETQEELEHKYHERISDKALDITFNKILDSSDMVKTFINSLNEFEDFDEKLKKYLNLLNENTKQSQELINNKKEKGIFDEELVNNFTERLIYLNNMTKDYYYQINESYNNLKDYLNNSLNEIDDSLKYCKDVTNIVFKDEYIKIKNEMIPFIIQSNYSNNDEENKVLNYSFSTSNTGEIKYNIDINNKKNAYFSIDLEFEDMEKYNPIVIAKIINLSAPKHMKMNIIPATSNCKDIETEIDVIFGSANYSMIITYNTTSTKKINVTTITHVEEYTYYIDDYRLSSSQPEEPQYIVIAGIIIDQNKANANSNNNCKKEYVENSHKTEEVKRKFITNSFIIDDFI